MDRDLHARTQARDPTALLLEQGVDERFLRADGSVAPPADLPAARGPIIGYVGTLEPHKFDAELVRATAAQLPDCSFVIVGPYHQNADCLRELPNVHFLGPKPHDEILRLRAGVRRLHAADRQDASGACTASRSS